MVSSIAPSFKSIYFARKSYVLVVVLDCGISHKEDPRLIFAAYGRRNKRGTQNGRIHWRSGL